MVAVETLGAEKSKANGLARKIGLDKVSNWSMPADGTDGKRTIELHGRP